MLVLFLFAYREVLVWKTCQSWSKLLAKRVVSVKAESATASIADITGRSGFVGLARVIRFFAAARFLCCSGSQTCSAERQFVPGDSAPEKNIPGKYCKIPTMQKVRVGLLLRSSQRKLLIALKTNFGQIWKLLRFSQRVTR